MVHLENGYPFDSDDFAAVGHLPLVRIRDLSADEFETHVAGSIPPRVVLRNGDLVIGMDGDFNVVRWSRGPAVLNQRLCLLRARGRHDLRFVEYALPDRLRFIRDTQFITTVAHLSSSEVLATRIVAPPPDEQRRIADFLDDQVKRIDDIIRQSKCQGELVAERLNAQREEAIFGASASELVPLGRLVDPRRPITYGIVQAGPDVADGVPYIKTGDLLDFHPHRLSRCSNEVEASYARSRVRPGDLVVAMRASIGATVVVPNDLPTANLTQGTARVAAVRGVDPGWLYEALVSPFVQEQMQMRAVGSTFRTLNLWDLRRVAVPTPSREVMQSVGSALGLAAASAMSARLAESKRRRLLEERKRALITAAVTGEFNVSSAGPRSVAAVTA